MLYLSVYVCFPRVIASRRRRVACRVLRNRSFCRRRRVVSRRCRRRFVSIRRSRAVKQHECLEQESKRDSRHSASNTFSRINMFYACVYRSLCPPIVRQAMHATGRRDTTQLVSEIAKHNLYNFSLWRSLQNTHQLFFISAMDEMCELRTLFVLSQQKMLKCREICQ